MVRKDFTLFRNELTEGIGKINVVKKAVSEFVDMVNDSKEELIRNLAETRHS